VKPELTPSHAGPRLPEGGRSSAGILEITWHRWRYRRAARRRRSGMPRTNQRKFLMNRPREKFIAGVLALALAPIALAACGGSSSKSSTGAAAATGTPSGTVKVASTGLGKILVNSSGLTLYLFEADKGATSDCSGACAAAWPPLVTSGKPTAGGGVNASLLGTTKRSDGTTQVTYNGHPLYRFASDTKPGDTTGQGVNGFGALWYGLSTAGSPITTQQASTGAGSGGNANPY
jgi:predicted lipoprotein with Yx(FWY)xxD motif